MVLSFRHGSRHFYLPKEDSIEFFLDILKDQKADTQTKWRTKKSVEGEVVIYRWNKVYDGPGKK